MIKWLHETGLCEAALVCLDEVAREGRLDVIMWLNDNGARATRAAVDFAAEAGHTSVVLYLLENRQEVGSCTPPPQGIVVIIRDIREPDSSSVIQAFWNRGPLSCVSR